MPANDEPGRIGPEAGHGDRRPPHTTASPSLNEQILSVVEEQTAKALGAFRSRLVVEARVYTAEQAGVFLGISDQQVRKLVRRGVLPNIAPHLGMKGQYRIPKASLEAFLAQATAEASRPVVAVAS